MVIQVSGSVQQTRNRAQRFFAEMGCDLVVFGQAETRQPFFKPTPLPFVNVAPVGNAE